MVAQPIAWLLLGGVLAATHAAERVSRRADAQDPTGAAQIAAVAAVRPRLEGGPVVLDPSGLCTARLAEWSCPQPVRAGLGRLGIALGSRAFTLVCPNGEASCRLVRARHLMAVRSARVGPTGGTVEVDVVSASAEDETAGVRRRTYAVEVARRGAGWAAVAVR